MLSRYLLPAVVAQAAAIVVLWLLWQGARDDVTAAVTSCNADKLAAVAEAEKAARVATAGAYAAEMRRLRQDVQAAERARLQWEQAAEEARQHAGRVRVVVRESASAETCLDTAVPDAVLDSLRSGPGS